MTCAIRPAIVSDIPAMHAIRCAVRENALTDPRRITEASYLSYVAAGSAWVAIIDRDIAGFAALDCVEASVWALFVAPEHEAGGIGRALLDTMLDEAARRGMDDLWLVTARGTRAERFYAQAGWTGMPAPELGEMRFAKALDRPRQTID